MSDAQAIIAQMKNTLDAEARARTAMKDQISGLQKGLAALEGFGTSLQQLRDALEKTHDEIASLREQVAGLTGRVDLLEEEEPPLLDDPVATEPGPEASPEPEAPMQGSDKPDIAEIDRDKAESRVQE